MDAEALPSGTIRTMQLARGTGSPKVARVASIVFGGYIALTSVVLTIVGVQSWGGWLSISYGLLGIAMGLGGIAATFVERPLRNALFGWFLVGVAFRTILDGSVYLIFVTGPIALLLLVALAIELIHDRNRASVAASLAAGAGAIVAIFVLRAVAPNFPPICPSTHPPTIAGFVILYPGNVGFWDEAQSKFTFACLSRPGSFTR